MNNITCTRSHSFIKGLIETEKLTGSTLLDKVRTHTRVTYRQEDLQSSTGVKTRTDPLCSHRNC